MSQKPQVALVSPPAPQPVVQLTLSVKQARALMKLVGHIGGGGGGSPLCLNPDSIPAGWQADRVRDLSSDLYWPLLRKLETIPGGPDMQEDEE